MVHMTQRRTRSARARESAPFGAAEDGGGAEDEDDVGHGNGSAAPAPSSDRYTEMAPGRIMVEQERFVRDVRKAIAERGARCTHAHASGSRELEIKNFKKTAPYRPVPLL